MSANNYLLQNYKMYHVCEFSHSNELLILTAWGFSLRGMVPNVGWRHLPPRHLSCFPVPLQHVPCITFIKQMYTVSSLRKAVRSPCCSHGEHQNVPHSSEALSSAGCSPWAACPLAACLAPKSGPASQRTMHPCLLSQSTVSPTQQGDV